MLPNRPRPRPRLRPRHWGICCLLAVCSPLAGAPSSAPPPAVRVWTEGSLTKVFPESPPGSARSVSLDACRGEWESFQVVVRAEDGVSGVTLAASDLRSAGGHAIAAANVEAFREHTVRVERPSGNAVTEPREWPDALLPMRVLRRTDVAAGRNLAFWIVVRVPAGARPGRYAGRITLSAGAKVLARVPVALRVWGILLPAANRQSAMAALYYDNILEYHNAHFREGKAPLAADSPEWQAAKERYFRFLLDYRICPYDLPAPLPSERADACLRDPRLNRFRLPWLGDDAEAFRASIQALGGGGHLARGVYYQFDEPPMAQYPAVKALAERVRQADPGIRRLLTLFPTPDLYGAVEIWCPDLGDTFGLGYLDPGILRERRAAGEETWWYTMFVPRYPYPTWLVDDDATAHRAFLWMQALYGITGFVYSQVHGWSDDPYTDVASYGGSNGDGLLLYPGDPFGVSEPFPSIRLQVIRDGLEDYECLLLLRERTRQTLRALGAPDADALSEAVMAGACRRLVGGLRSFSRRPEDYARARRDLLAAIARCGDRPRLVVALGQGAGPAGLPLTIVAERGARVTVAGKAVRLDALGRAVVPVRPDALPVTVTARRGWRARTARVARPWPEERAPAPPAVECPLLPAAPVLDGAIGADEWRGAAPLQPAVRANGLGPAGAKTECWLGRDAARLYFAARCHFGDQSRDVAEQSVGLILDAPPLGDAKLELLMSGVGRRYAMLKSRRGYGSPRLGWAWAQQAADGAWECEMSLDFDDLLPAPTPGAAWGIDVERQAGSESSTWALTYGDIRRLGRLTFR